MPITAFNSFTDGLEANRRSREHFITIIFQIDVSNAVFAAPSIRLEAVSETVEGSDWHTCSYWLSASVVTGPARVTFSREPLARTREGRNSKYRLRPSMSRQP